MINTYNSQGGWFVEFGGGLLCTVCGLCVGQSHSSGVTRGETQRRGPQVECPTQVTDHCQKNTLRPKRGLPCLSSTCPQPKVTRKLLLCMSGLCKLIAFFYKFPYFSMFSMDQTYLYQHHLMLLVYVIYKVVSIFIVISICCLRLL